MSFPVAYWHKLDGGKIQCDLCPRLCQLNDGQHGFCFVRAREGNTMVLTTYGRSSGFCIDPIEKKPLHHFYPGSSVLSFGTAGCNLACRFCQNWSISTSKDTHDLAAHASPDSIAQAAKDRGCHSVAFTYNDPVVFAEYAMDTADQCHERGVCTVAVTAGYINSPAREAFFDKMDAVNIDLKAFSETFYRKQSAARLAPVLETIKHVYQKKSCWMELTTLLIPDLNDSEREVSMLCSWIMEHLGPEVPIHFSAFHPAHRLRNKAPTAISTLIRARDIALKHGLHFVYTGNVHHRDGDTTFCPSCHSAVIQRDWYEIKRYQLQRDGHCQHCGHAIAGRFAQFRRKKRASEYERRAQL